jgi:hypothetical protein
MMFLRALSTDVRKGPQASNYNMHYSVFGASSSPVLEEHTHRDKFDIKSFCKLNQILNGESQKGSIDRPRAECMHNKDKCQDSLA